MEYIPALRLLLGLSDSRGIYSSHAVSSSLFLLSLQLLAFTSIGPYQTLATSKASVVWHLQDLARRLLESSWLYEIKYWEIREGSTLVYQILLKSIFCKIRRLTVFKTHQKVSLLRAKQAKLISKKTLGDSFLPLEIFFQIFSDSGYLQCKMTWKNLKKFSRDKNESPKV